MIFRTNNKEYAGATAVEIVLQLAQSAAGFTARADDEFYEFLQWSLEQFSDRLPARELALSPRVSDETLARGYLSLCHEYGIGELTD